MEFYIDDNNVMRKKEEYSVVISTSNFDEFEIAGVDESNIDATIAFLDKVDAVLKEHKKSF